MKREEDQEWTTVCVEGWVEILKGWLGRLLKKVSFELSKTLRRFRVRHIRVRHLCIWRKHSPGEIHPDIFGVKGNCVCNLLSDNLEKNKLYRYTIFMCICT